VSVISLGYHNNSGFVFLVFTVEEITLQIMDLASGIVGLTSFALELFTVLQRYIRDVKDAPQEMKTLARQLESLTSALSDFSAFDSSQDAADMGFEPSKSLQIAIEGSTESISKVVIRKDGPSTRLKDWIERLKFPFKKDDYQHAIDTLHICTSAFQFSLHIAQW
jgi:hypothetical protein